MATAAGSAPSALAAPPSAAPLPTRAGLSAAVDALLRAPGLGAQVRARVVDIASGAVLLDRSGSAAATPASTAKLLTAAALLAVRRPTDRLRTVVRAGTGGSIVLVGAGDPTLSAAAPGQSSRYPGAARLSELAAQLRAAHLRVTSIVVADGLFRGPAVSPAWAADDVPSDYGAPITAVMADGGRAAPADVVRSNQPDLDAGHALARLLDVPALPVRRGAAGNGAALASVWSAPLGTLIGQMLRYSDNVIAECLGRQVALADRGQPSFTGAAAAIAAVLHRLGVAVGTGMVDASGLAERDRLSPAVLVAVLRTSARTPRLRDALDGLPVAGWSGTLVGRYDTGVSRAGIGAVRAKTGTLTGVSALAGLVHDRSGALLGFAVLADRTPDNVAAEHALDDVAGRLALCGCR
ncbi:MAG TPA: D-alanyl-D-alanine carboxypeptidase/D-alanyl-D-alanine-endopeptidase [Jatrophihabitans sp.]|nr:D-alanyl-D-alanine carboxypeptidase/D-alanyl-D-alanine-endopeptidase [Jatrophihabitans sp.]